MTHLVYAALFEKPGLVAGWRERDQMETNLQMFRNILDPLTDHASGLEHVTLLQGTKAYGAHVATMTVPGRERTRVIRTRTSTSCKRTTSSPDRSRATGRGRSSGRRWSSASHSAAT